MRRIARPRAPSRDRFEARLAELRSRRPHVQAPLFQTVGVTVRFGGVTACNGVDITINQGEIAALIGPNGAGKTTLFNAVSGFLAPDGGRVRFEGRDVSDLPAHERASLGMVRTFQQMQMFSSMTAVENLMTAQHLTMKAGFFSCGLGLALAKHQDTTAEARAIETLEFLGLADAAHRNVMSLPYGQQRLVELGRVLALSPKLVMLDEPTAGMDPAETEELASRVRRIRDEMGITVFLIEHDVPFVASLADHVYVLDFGVVIAHGTPDEVRADPAVKAAYLGEEVA